MIAAGYVDQVGILFLHALGKIEREVHPVTSMALHHLVALLTAPSMLTVIMMIKVTSDWSILSLEFVPLK